MEQEFFNAAVLSLNFEQLQALLPYLWLCLGIALSVFAAGYRANLKVLRSSILFALLPFIFLLLKGISLAPQSIFGTSLELNAFTKSLSVGIGLLALLAGIFAKNDEENSHPEWAPLLLISTLGLSLLPAARDWGAFFVYLELASIPAYILAAADTKRSSSLEAGLKYLMMGAFSTALFLMGVALCYGLVGDLDFASFAEASAGFAGVSKLVAIVGALFIFVGLAFKVAIFPFHMWAPDVYQAAPTALASYLATATKLSVFCALLGAFDIARIWNLDYMQNIAVWLGITTLVVGSLMAMAQRQLRRMLAYSSIVNAGYVLMGVSLGSLSATTVYLYLLVYGLTLIGIFAVIESFLKSLGRSPNGDIDFDELPTLSARAPKLAIVFFILGMFSLTGIPPFPGFITKYLLLKDLWFAHQSTACFFIILGTLLGLAYYLRAIVPFFSEKGKNLGDHKEPIAVSAMLATCLCALVLGFLFWGLNGFLTWSSQIEGWVR